MLTLMLLRHAKSSWEDARLDDFDRPLAPRGTKAAQAMAQHLKGALPVPETIVCSPAQRARETLAHLLPALSGEMDIVMDRALYDLGSPRALWKHVVNLGIVRERLMLVGHNPLLEGLAALLAGEGEDEAMAAMREKYPTGALAVIEFQAKEWAEVAAGSGRLTGFVRPRDLTG